MYKGDRQKLNEEMMKLYQEHKVNPLASCFPLLLQMPVFIIMFRVLHGLTHISAGQSKFSPQYLSTSSKLFKSLNGEKEMLAWGLDLSKRPYAVVADSFGKGLLYVGLVLILGLLYFAQQRMVASRATVSPTISANQQKLMQYLPVVFAIFMGFYLTGLVIYYFAQAVFRIGLNWYITHRFYKGEHSLGQQAQRASEKARELHKDSGGGGGFFAQAKQQAAKSKEAAAPTTSSSSKRVTPPKNKPTAPAARSTSRPASTGRAAREGNPRSQQKKK
jgi:YidC/Oxa1 family membrane protein insertase